MRIVTIDIYYGEIIEMLNDRWDLFLNNILAQFIFYLPDDMTVVDHNVYYYNEKYYTDDVNLKDLYILVTNDWRFKSNSSIYIPKFRYFRGNDFPTFYDIYVFNMSEWNIKKNFEANHMLFKNGCHLSVTLLFNLICRSLNTLEIHNLDLNFIPQITYICRDLNLDYNLSGNNITIFNISSKLDRDKIIKWQDFSDYDYNIFSKRELTKCS